MVCHWERLLCSHQETRTGSQINRMDKHATIECRNRARRRKTRFTGSIIPADSSARRNWYHVIGIPRRVSLKNSQPLSEDNHSPQASANFSKGEAVSVIPDDITTINKLPDEILLEIFDSYRRGFGRQHNYENIWNGKNGWFKARTCVPKLASRRACLTLPFTFAAYLRAALVSKGRSADSSSPLPVFVNCGAGTWNFWEENRVLSALRYSNRVWGIGIGQWGTAPETLLKVLNYPLPELENLELNLSTEM